MTVSELTKSQAQLAYDALNDLSDKEAINHKDILAFGFKYTDIDKLCDEIEYHLRTTWFTKSQL